MAPISNGSDRNLLSSPGNEKPPKFERQQVEYEDLTIDFNDKLIDFSKQFCHIYSIRLADLRAVLIPRVIAKWGKIQILKLAELEDFEEQECVIIGTLYKHQKWKPSILHELSEDHQLTLSEPKSNYCSEKDLLFLEDEMLRIRLLIEDAELKNYVTGNSVKTVTKTNTLMGHAEGKAQDATIAKEVAVATTLLDTFLTKIATCCCVTLMPGQHDPANTMLPQKSLHPCILPLTSRFESFKGVTNPWIGKVAERIIMGSSGQPIEDIVKATGMTDISPLNWLERTLVWRHMCPTAPDTLPVYPYSVKDPFIINYCPDIYFVGNTDEFETKLWIGEENQMVRLICIPKYSSTNLAVMVDIETLDTTTINFGTSI
ncbi:hypothetical protein ACFW04_007553 [Cataglyphis niger]